MTYNAEYYALGHASKFVRRGAHRIASNTFAGGIENVAFRNPDGGKVLVAYNAGTASATFKVRWAGQSFIYTLPGRRRRDLHLVDLRRRRDLADRLVQRVNTQQQQVRGRGQLGHRPTARPFSSGPAAPAAQPAVAVHADQQRLLPRVPALRPGAGLGRDRRSPPPTARPSQLWTYGGGNNQQWLPQPQASGTWRFVARHSGNAWTCRVLDVRTGRAPAVDLQRHGRPVLSDWCLQQ